MTTEEPYYRLHRMTREQRSLITEYMRGKGVQVVAEGVDLIGRPVINFKDVNGWHEPFAIKAGGFTAKPHAPVVPLTVEDVHPEDQDILYGILPEEGV